MFADNIVLLPYPSQKTAKRHRGEHINAMEFRNTNNSTNYGCISGYSPRGSKCVSVRDRVYELWLGSIV